MSFYYLRKWMRFILLCFSRYVYRTLQAIPSSVCMFINLPLYKHIFVVFSLSVMSSSLPPMDCSPPGSSYLWDVPGKNTGVGCYFLLQGIFLTQGSNPHFLHLLHWQVSPLPLTSPGKPHVTTLISYTLVEEKCLLSTSATDCIGMRPNSAEAESH